MNLGTLVSCFKSFPYLRYDVSFEKFKALFSGCFTHYSSYLDYSKHVCWVHFYFSGFNANFYAHYLAKWALSCNWSVMVSMNFIPSSCFCDGGFPIVNSLPL